MKDKPGISMNVPRLFAILLLAMAIAVLRGLSRISLPSHSSRQTKTLNKILKHLPPRSRLFPTAQRRRNRDGRVSGDA